METNIMIVIISFIAVFVIALGIVLGVPGMLGNVWSTMTYQFINAVTGMV